MGLILGFRLTPLEPGAFLGRLQSASHASACAKKRSPYLVDMEVISVISDEMRVVVESEWPELVHKLPPK
jgi:hypothetical protein